MTVRELRKALKKLPPDLPVEMLDPDGSDSREVYEATVREVTRGWALPVPRTYDIVVLAAGFEGL